MTIKEKNRELAAQHWEYVGSMLDTSINKGIYTKEYVIKQCQFHFLTAWEHGAKHTQELLEKEKLKDNTNNKHTDCAKYLECLNEASRKKIIDMSCDNCELYKEFTDKILTNKSLTELADEMV